MNPSASSLAIKDHAIRLGFDACGIARAQRLSRQEAFLKTWLERGLHAGMNYMSNYFDKRADPRELLVGAQSVISVLLNYYPEKKQHAGGLKVAKYAYGKDYHRVIKEKLRQLLKSIQSEITPCEGRFFTDSAPVLDRAWAAEAGLGWIGKNTNLIVPQQGSFFFIGELIIDIELEYDVPIEDHCGSCTKCIQACPTNALVLPYLLDSNRCISYHTIESKNTIPEKYRGKFENWIFGCDICQDVCPWNRFSKQTHEPAFQPDEEFLRMDKDDWRALSEEKYKKRFSGKALERKGFEGIKNNIAFVSEESE